MYPTSKWLTTLSPNLIQTANRPATCSTAQRPYSKPQDSLICTAPNGSPGRIELVHDRPGVDVRPDTPHVRAQRADSHIAAGSVLEKVCRCEGSREAPYAEVKTSSKHAILLYETLTPLVMVIYLGTLEMLLTRCHQVDRRLASILSMSNRGHRQISVRYQPQRPLVRPD